MRYLAMIGILTAFSMGLMVVPAGQKLFKPGIECNCSATGHETLAQCGSCSIPIMLPLNCQVCCDNPTCKKKDGPGGGT